MVFILYIVVAATSEYLLNSHNTFDWASCSDGARNGPHEMPLGRTKLKRSIFTWRALRVIAKQLLQLPIRT